MTDKTVKREYIKFAGLCKWAKIMPGQQEGPMEPEEKNRDDLSFSIQVECSKKRFNKLLEDGLSKNYELKEDKETQKTYITLRATKQKTKKDAKPLVFPDLKVIDKYRQPVTQEVGNDSEVICIAELVEGTNPKFKGKIFRLKCVQVINHIIYEREDSIEAYSDLLEDAELPETINEEDVEDQDEDDADYL